MRTFLEPPLVYAVAAGFVLLLVASLLLTRYLNRRYVVLRPGEATDQLAFQLSRIAESLESLAASSAKWQQRMEVALERIEIAARAGSAAGPPVERRPRITPYAHELGAWAENRPTDAETPADAEIEGHPQHD